jgi:predicted O-methyltransferase YrrM
MFRSIPPPDHDIILFDRWRKKADDGWTCPWMSEVETATLCHYAELSGGNIVEIGCNQGYTTAALAANNPTRKVYGIDCSNSAKLMVAQQRTEHPKAIGREARIFPNVTLIDVNSALLDYARLEDVRFVFIDGGHHYDQVKIDSKKALAHLRSKTGGYVFWHDYGRKLEWIGVDDVLTEIVHPTVEVSVIKGTSLAFVHLEAEKGPLRWF